jgi:hypothetical protein
MDQKKLEQFVGTYAEYIYHTDPGSDHRKDPCSDNPKASLVIVKLKAWPTDCEDCGKHCTGKIDKSLVWDFAKERWNQRCLSCKRAFNHATGAWEYAAKKSNIRPKDPATGKPRAACIVTVRFSGECAAPCARLTHCRLSQITVLCRREMCA